jgi:hypothetical protein
MRAFRITWYRELPMESISILDSRFKRGLQKVENYGKNS